ncbi:undecaprenyldiphospho-muramoylpentapeptide beta-N-acetylglucosaminyltransferase [Proteinivorax hydrogeniformans]|uniref:UDP-N-acetylglucosamine--N-acetylmuramyl-(pentapeptide) pyrophosphoryl-undecaprenol N-acetylglucosamine transferase n=1 Tax=Proteinivorax hydrogeniformans TaxID=1826727 RepID=A0AAU8HVV8_9FIRM
MKKIILTGGGTAGHVTPNIALLPKLKKLGYEIYYIGSKNGIERQLIEELNIKYFAISSGKLRRYFHKDNFTDPFRVLRGMSQAASIIKRIKPDIIFSKGGFVTVPVIMAAKLKKVPTIIHESDYTPGLANKIAIPFCSKVCVTFPETLNHVPKEKGIYTGSPIREDILNGDSSEGYKETGFSTNKPVIMVMGGSLGAAKINEHIRNILPKLLDNFNVIHLCGEGKVEEGLLNKVGYVQYPYVKNQLPHLLSITDVVISRAGANSIFEFLALKKPNILIPLSKAASRGDQILNAESFLKQGFSEVIHEESLTDQMLLEKVEDVYKNRASYIEKMEKDSSSLGLDKIIELIEKNRGKK